jgi:integrase/recombinase XerD
MPKQPRRHSTAARRPRSSVLGHHLEEFCRSLEVCGYTASTILQKSGYLHRLARWMESRELQVRDLDERCAKAFITARRRRGLQCGGVPKTVRQLIEYLRSRGTAARPMAASDGSVGAAILGRYEAYLRAERGLASETISDYLFSVRPFVVDALAGGEGALAKLSMGMIRGFLLQRARHVTPQRTQAVAKALRSFLRFLFLRGHTPADLSRGLPTVRQGHILSISRHIPPQDVERVLAACDLTSATGRRDYAILLLLARLGLRAGEVVKLELGDLRWREGEIVVRGKGANRDRLPLLPDVGAAIARYLREDRPRATCQRLFLCRKAPYRGFARAGGISNRVGHAFARAGLRRRGAHALRHSLATTMLRRGASLAEIAQVLRHRSPASTERYAKLDFGALRTVALPWPVAGDVR